MEKPFAITLDVASSLANKTGSWRTERAVYSDRLPPCNHACPAGENIQGWLYEAEEGAEGYERGWRKIMEDNPFPAIMGRVCYHPCETACNRGQLDEAVGINSVERFLGDEAIKNGWTVDAPGRALGETGADRRGGTIRAFGRVPPHPAWPHRGHPRRRPNGRRNDALRDPQVPVAAGRARSRGPADPRHGSDPGARTARSPTSSRRCERATLTRPSLRSGRTSASAPTSPPARRRTSSTPSRCCAAWRERSGRCWGGAWSCTAAAIPRWTWRGRPSASARPRRSSSTGVRVSRCQRTTSRSRRRRRRA